MAYLSDTARVVLAAAAQRDDLSVLPFPDGVKAKGGAEQKVLAGLRKRGFVRVIETPGRPQRIVITSEGMAAIGIEPDDSDTGPAKADTGATAAKQASGNDAPAPTPAGDGAVTAGRGKTKAKGAKAKSTKPEKAAPDEKPTLRAGTKQAQMIEMLKRPRGRHGRADRRGHRLAAPHHPRRHLWRAEEETRPDRRGHPHPRDRPQQHRRQRQRNHLPDHRLTSRYPTDPTPPRLFARRRSSSKRRQRRP